MNISLFLFLLARLRKCTKFHARFVKILIISQASKRSKSFGYIIGDKLRSQSWVFDYFIVSRNFAPNVTLAFFLISHLKLPNGLDSTNATIILNVKIIFSPFKLSTMFNTKDFVPDSVKSRVVYQFTCANFGARHIGETNRHFNTRINEYLFRDKNSHIFKRLSASKGCRDKCYISCFKILDHAST